MPGHAWGVGLGVLIIRILLFRGTILGSPMDLPGLWDAELLEPPGSMAWRPTLSR